MKYLIYIFFFIGLSFTVHSQVNSPELIPNLVGNPNTFVEINGIKVPSKIAYYNQFVNQSIPALKTIRKMPAKLTETVPSWRYQPLNITRSSAKGQLFDIIPVAAGEAANYAITYSIEDQTDIMHEKLPNGTGMLYKLEIYEDMTADIPYLGPNFMQPLSYGISPVDAMGTFLTTPGISVPSQSVNHHRYKPAFQYLWIYKDKTGLTNASVIGDDASIQKLVKDANIAKYLQISIYAENEYQELVLNRDPKSIVSELQYQTDYWYGEFKKLEKKIEYDKRKELINNLLKERLKYQQQYSRSLMIINEAGRKLKQLSALEMALKFAELGLGIYKGIDSYQQKQLMEKAQKEYKSELRRIANSNALLKDKLNFIRNELKNITIYQRTEINISIKHLKDIKELDNYLNSQRSMILSQ